MIRGGSRNFTKGAKPGVLEDPIGAQGQSPGSGRAEDEVLRGWRKILHEQINEQILTLPRLLGSLA